MSKLFNLDAFRASLEALKSYLDNYIAQSSHSHSNQDILDQTTEAFTGIEKDKLVENSTQIEQIIDGETSIGHAATADKLSTGQDFSISGGATAEKINFDGSNQVNLNVTSLNAMKLQVTKNDTLVMNGDCL